jgi:hypothetical protein
MVAPCLLLAGWRHCRLKLLRRIMGSHSISVRGVHGEVNCCQSLDQPQRSHKEDGRVYARFAEIFGAFVDQTSQGLAAD